jgi:hypothetical protein
VRPAKAGTGTVTWTDSSTAQNTIYWYEVLARNPLGNSTWAVSATGLQTRP